MLYTTLLNEILSSHVHGDLRVNKVTFGLPKTDKIPSLNCHRAIWVS